VASSGRWTTPSELAEYAYCPRAWHYRVTREEPEPSPLQLAGTRYHRRELAGERRRADRPGLVWLLALVGAALVLGGVVLAVRGGWA
jgi:hypothetical protein